MKYFKKRKLRKYLENLNSGKFTKEYLNYHESKISCIEFLISYYENRTACSPKDYFKALLNDKKGNNIEEISFLYYWIYYSEITGF